jgi:hypothetical protein
MSTQLPYSYLKWEQSMLSNGNVDFTLFWDIFLQKKLDFQRINDNLISFFHTCKLFESQYDCYFPSLDGITHSHFDKISTINRLFMNSPHEVTQQIVLYNNLSPNNYYPSFYYFISESSSCLLHHNFPFQGNVPGFWCYNGYYGFDLCSLISYLYQCPY